MTKYTTNSKRKVHNRTEVARSVLSAAVPLSETEAVQGGTPPARQIQLDRETVQFHPATNAALFGLLATAKQSDLPDVQSTPCGPKAQCRCMVDCNTLAHLPKTAQVRYL
jgi:hypothetical protein